MEPEDFFQLLFNNDGSWFIFLWGEGGGFIFSGAPSSFFHVSRRNKIAMYFRRGARGGLALATNFNPSYTLLVVAHHAQYDLRDVASLVTSFPSVP